VIVLLPTRQWGCQFFSLPIDGQIRYGYIPYESELLEIDDLWYERRKGPSAAELTAHKVWHQPITTRKGKFSALCHAKFTNDVMTWPDCNPEDALDLMHLISEVGSTMAYTDHLVEGSWNTYRGHMVYRITGPDGSPGLRSVYLWLQPCYAQVSLEITDVYGVYKPYTWSNETWHTMRRSSLSLAQFAETLDPNYWSVSTMIRWAEYVADTASPDIRSLWDQRPRWSVSPKVDPDYVKAQVSNAYQSALRYRDTELVDWSVDALAHNATPWALGCIDIITGRARSFIEATKDIPLLSENSLQNLFAAFSGLKAFAFGAEETSKMFDSVLKAKLPTDWYMTNARGRTPSQQRAYRRYLEKLSQRILLYSDGGDRLDVASDAWLTGRYVFSTSVSDLGSAWDYFYDLALQNIGKRSGDYKCHGSSVEHDTEVACTFTARERALEGVTKFFEHCYRTGMEPNAYVMWDFVPFSFVVDWFFPVGNALNAYTRASHFTPEFWDFQPVYDGKQFCYSVKYREDTFLGPVDVYTRWYESGPPEVESAYFLRPETASTQTQCKRVLDGIALFHP
jgi:hypothetical protein